MKAHTRTTQFNPVVLVCDSGALGLPSLVGKVPIQAADTCIAIRNATTNGLLTRLIVSDEFVARPGEFACTRRVQTPSGVLVVMTVLLETFASMVTRRGDCIVRVYTNAPWSPIAWS